MTTSAVRDHWNGRELVRINPGEIGLSSLQVDNLIADCIGRTVLGDASGGHTRDGT